MASRFWRKLAEGEIHFRDDWQFELKSEFSPSQSVRKNSYTQEFYLFIPDALRIDRSTYSRQDFFRDQTTLIRYKTPEFTFPQLLDPANEESPLRRLRQGTDDLEGELKLLGNVVRSQLRERVRELILLLNDDSPNLHTSALTLVDDLRDVLRGYSQLKELPETPFKYVGEFMELSIHVYLTGFLEDYRTEVDQPSDKVDLAIRSLILEARAPAFPHEGSEQEQEYVLYRKGLLNKYVLDALLLSVERKAVIEQYRSLSGMIAAGIAMFIYMLLFVWQGELFVINSLPFVFITVILYILKDRLKEGVKALYSRKAFRWFPDYRTAVRTPDRSKALGSLTESFTFIDPSRIPPEVLRVRNEGFHEALESFKRPETVILYKQVVTMQHGKAQREARRQDINTIFRFNVHNFLLKASNAWQSFPFLTNEGQSIERVSLPKVYHLNIIAKNNLPDTQGARVLELQKFRCVLDKRGIKRVDRL